MKSPFLEKGSEGSGEPLSRHWGQGSEEVCGEPHYLGLVDLGVLE